MDSISLEQLPACDRLLVLCATSRLAQSLRARYDLGRARRHEATWTTLDARTVAQWLDGLAEERLLRGEDAPPGSAHQVLDAFQERLLWERVIGDSLDDAEQALFDTPAMATTAAEAHALAVGWNITVQPSFASNENRRFKDWQSRFLGLCRKHGWIDSARRQKALVAGIVEAKPSLPDRVLFAGFDRFTPLELELQQALRKRGVGLGILDTGRDATAIRAVSFPDGASECLAAALWAQRHLAANPGARLGIVVPDLAGNRDLLQDTLDDILVPAAIRPGLAEMPRPFNISLGRTLSHHPLVSTAFDLLRLSCTSRPIEQSDFSRLLRSPYWSAAAAEADSRARLEAELRRGVAPKASLGRLIGFITRSVGQGKFPCRALAQHLEALQRSALDFKRARLPSAWAGAFLAALDKTGWLAERKLASHEYQTQQAFLEETRKLARLDSLLGEIDAATALTDLRRLCTDRVFQPRTVGDPPIQVMGLLEAGGLQFDALWVMGMVDNAWPPPARPNPLLSAEAQRTAQSPNASATVQFAFASSVHRRLGRSAADITFSWPRMDAAAALRPSPLLSDLLPGEERDAPTSGRPGSALAAAIADATAPAVQNGETIKGGTAMLRAQAICPAWAYYQFRLGAAKLPEAVEGLDAAKRGSLVHDALEFFWKSVGTSSGLKAMNIGEREQEIGAAIDAALNAHDARQEPLQPRFRALERRRLVKLMQRWLALELSRPQDFAVVACERRLDVDIEGIAAAVQIDRIDRLEDGRLMVIDYKTGARVDTKNWASQRITEPQLPIYAAVARPAEGPVAAVVFAKVLLQDPAFAGLGADPDLLPKITVLNSKAGRRLFPETAFPDWASVLEHWHERIHAVARELKAGDAGVRFEDEQSLRYCDVLPLLRLAERKMQLENAALPEN